MEHCSMMIVDAIRSASSQHAVYFLVTAYVESLRQYECSSRVPPEALDLPIGDRAELERRLDMLRIDTTVALESIVAVSELVAVLTSAVERLDALCTDDAAAIMPLVRSDSPHPALSV